MFDHHCGFLCIAHRGASGHEPGNTIASVRKALELGARTIEIDVHYLRKKLIVAHDTVMSDPLRGTIDISKCSWEQIRSIDVGEGQSIPTLEEVLDVIHGDAHVDIELKGRGSAVPVCELIRTLIKKKLWPEDRFILSSFDIRELEAARAICPDICMGLLIERRDIDFIRLATRVRACFIGSPLAVTDPELIRSAQSNDLKVLVFTVNDRPSINRIKSMGADGVFTDFPELCS